MHVFTPADAGRTVCFDDAGDPGSQMLRTGTIVSVDGTRVTIDDETTVSRLVAPVEHLADAFVL